MASFFFLVFPFRGEVLGLSIAFVYLLIIFLFMDKWLLLFFFAFPAKRGDKLLEKFQNKAYGYSVRDVKFYYSRIPIDNVIALQWVGRKIIIVDSALRNSPNAEAFLDDVLESFRTKEISKNSVMVFVFTVYNLPLVILEKFFGRFKIYGLLSALWLTPFKLLLEGLENKKRKKLNPDCDATDNSELDTYTVLLSRITSIYQSPGSDLVSMIFDRSGI